MKPILPVIHRRLEMASIEPLIESSAAISVADGATAASAAAQAPDTTVNAPDAPNSTGTSGVPSRSRIIHVLDRNQAPPINVRPETNRAAPPKP